MSMSRFRTPRWRKLRTAAFVVLGSSAFIPLLHGSQLFGLKYMLRHSGMKWYLPELACSFAGVTFYGVSLPLTVNSLRKISNLTDNCRPELPSVLLRANSTSGALHIRSSMSPSCAPYTSIHSHSGRLSWRVIRWTFVKSKPPTEQATREEVACLQACKICPSLMRTRKLLYQLSKMQRRHYWNQ